MPSPVEMAGVCAVAIFLLIAYFVLLFYSAKVAGFAFFRGKDTYDRFKRRKQAHGNEGQKA